MMVYESDVHAGLIKIWKPKVAVFLNNRIHVSPKFLKTNKFHKTHNFFDYISKNSRLAQPEQYRILDPFSQLVCLILDSSFF